MFKANNEELQLPITLEISDISTAQTFGVEFDGLEIFLKRTIIEALSSSSTIHGDAIEKMHDKITSHMQKYISVIVNESTRSSNSIKILKICRSYIVLRVRSLRIVFLTLNASP